MMMMHTPGRGAYGVSNWKPEELKAHIQFMHAFNAKLKSAGELVDAQGLAGPDQAKLVRAGSEGQPLTDGVFPESKEFLAGYWIIEVDTPEQAYARAAQASMAPGPGGKPLHLTLELRQVMSAPPVD